MQWSRNVAAVDGEEPEDSADVESCGSNETSTVSGENDGKCWSKRRQETRWFLGTKLLFPYLPVSLDETSSNASCSTESQSRPLSNPRDSHRASSQVMGHTYW